MSEPDAAFMKLHTSRASLVRWLDGPVRPASAWHDWRQIPGQYYIGGGVLPLSDIPDAEMAKQVEDCDAGMRRYPSNRAALRDVLDSAEAPYLKRCTYDEATAEFLVGSLTYAENLILYMQFLAVARGAASALEADATGVALIHNYIWEPDEKRIALRLGPGPASSFVSDAATYRDIVATFRPVADAMLAAAQAAGEDSDGTRSVDVLDELRSPA